MTKPTRRRFITTAAAGAMGAALPLHPSVAAATADHPADRPGARRTGTVRDVKHVVVLMQENRSFDHYFGTLGGVRGFDDRQQLRYPGGSDVFHQSDPTRAGGRVLSPFRMDTRRFNAQEAQDLDHSWGGTHAAADHGAWDRWIGAKGEQTMGYFTRDDIPWQYALADAFTICDNYFCSIQGPTTPNRLFHWTGTIDPVGGSGGPAISNPADYQPVYDWTTYPERLQKAGVSWQVYANDEIGDDGDHPFVGDYGDNPLWLFQAYHDALASADPSVRELAVRGGLHAEWKPDSGDGDDVAHVLAPFLADCRAGTLPTVSWVVAPYGYCEHPRARPVDGADYINGVLQGLWANPELWASTVVLINFDENDGFFDHVLPPEPPPGTTGEFVQGLPVGLGPRVPMTVVSPWSSGGWVNSEVFDHTSVLRFLEVVTGVTEPNISAWRRAVCGDLTSCFDFTSHDRALPSLPAIGPLLDRADRERTLPAVSAPSGPQTMAKSEHRTRRVRPPAYRLTGNVAVDRMSGKMTVALANPGRRSAALHAYQYTRWPLHSDALFLPAAGSLDYQVDTTLSDSRYDLALHGPDGFLREFTGAVISESRTDAGVPEVGIELLRGRTDMVLLRLRNAGNREVRFTVLAGSGSGPERTVHVRGGHCTDMHWPADKHRYDLAVTAVTAVTADTGEGFRYRFAGAISTG